MNYAYLSEHTELLYGQKHDVTIDLECGHCGGSYLKKVKAVRDDIVKGGSKNYCSTYCVGQSQRLLRQKFVCAQCSKEGERLPKDFEGKNAFCSKSCAAIFNNLNRDPLVYANLSNTLKAKYPKKLKIIRKKTAKKNREKKTVKIARPITIETAKLNQRMAEKLHTWGPSTRIYFLCCKHSGTAFCSRTLKKYCKNFAHLYSREQKAEFKFTFNIFHYPNLFDLSLIEKHGWYSVGGKNKRPINKTGCSRDHKISINDAIKNGYDCYYIKHPLNCTLMLHSDNNKKKTRSSICYDELVRLVDEYDGGELRARFPLLAEQHD